MNKTFCKILVFLSVVLIIFNSCVSTNVEPAPEPPKITKDYKMVNINEKFDYLVSDLTYPQFDSYPDFNKLIKNTIESNWKNFKIYTESEWNELNSLNSNGSVSSLPPFEYKVTSAVTYRNDYLSVLFTIYIFNGGAHGNTSLISYNYNTQTAKVDNIITASGMTYNQISEICREKLYTDLITNNKTLSNPTEKAEFKEMINTGAFPQAGNYEIFTLDKDNMFVYFEPYSVAPYVYGIQKIQIKLK